jgi:hypothetical protein
MAHFSMYQQKNAIYPFEQLALVWLEKLLCGKNLRPIPQLQERISVTQKSVKAASKPRPVVAVYPSSRKCSRCLSKLPDDIEAKKAGRSRRANGQD